MPLKEINQSQIFTMTLSLKVTMADFQKKRHCFVIKHLLTSVTPCGTHQAYNIRDLFVSDDFLIHLSNGGRANILQV